MEARGSWIGFACVAVLGLGLYLWGALAAPAVVWSDSRLDMEWARSGAGIWKPITDTRGDAALHPAKPGYLLFLRAAGNVVPGAGQARSVILVQSLLLWASLAGTSLYVGRRKGAALGAALLLFLTLFLRLRDAASNVMSEGISAAGFLVLVAVLFCAPRRRGAYLIAGVGTAALFWIRPNVGLVAFLVGILALRRWREATLLAGGFAAVVLPVWLATRHAAGGGAVRGLAHPVYAATAEYYWLPSLGAWPQGTAREREAEEFRRAAVRWKTLAARRDPDARRELIWRGLWGFFGTEFYDARWSAVYATLTRVSRVASPFAILAAIALLLSRPFAEAEENWNLAAPFLLLLAAAQNLLLGSHPRYILPFLPGIFLLGLAGLRARGRWASLSVALVVALGGAVLLLANRGVLGWEWGRIETAGVKITQPLPRGSLPAHGPATLHLRIASPDPNSGAGWRLAASGREILSSEGVDKRRPVLSANLPDWLLEENRQRSVDLSLVSKGAYGDTSYLLFPVVPPPWARLAQRDGSSSLSPSTGLRRGSLDWWAHEGMP